MPKDHSPIYRTCLRQAFFITLKNKQLWILGFFATFLSSMGIYDIALRGVQGAVNRGAFRTLVVPNGSLALDAFSIPLTMFELGGKLSILLPIFIFLALLCAVFIWAGVISQGGLMFATAKEVKSSKFDLKDCFHAGVANFWPLLGTNLVAKLVASLLLAGISVPVFLVLKSGGFWPTITYFLLFLLLVPAALIVSFLGIFSGAGIVTKKLNLFDAFRTACAQFSRHWLVCVEMALIILVLGFFVSLGIILAVLMLSVPFVILAVIASLFAGNAGAGFVFLVAFAILFAFAIIVGSAFTTFQIAAWTLLYLRFVEKGAVAKIIRLFAALPKFLTPRRR